MRISKNNFYRIIYKKGNINDDIDFTYGEGTAAYYGCGASLMGEFWYFGGYQGPVNTLRQASKIEGQGFMDRLVIGPVHVDETL